MERDEIRSGCITPTFQGAQTGAVLIRNPYIAGLAPMEGDKLRNGYITLAFLGAQTREGFAT